MEKLTIHTPAYNNARHLVKLFESLKKQTCRDFKWLIVDDGSEDDTKETAAGFLKEADFPVQYIYQENQGKYMAHYHAIQKCDTELFLCVDADYILYEEIVEILLKKWDDFQREPEVIGIGVPVLYRNYSDLTQIVGGVFPKTVPESGKLHELTSRFHYHGETAYVFRTEVIKQLNIPKRDGEKFWSESGFYFPLNKNYKVHWLNIPMGESIYQPDGLTNNRFAHELKSPSLTLLTYKRGAVYHPVFLHRVANCCLYISWKRLLGAADDFPERISWYVYLMACLLEPVYCRTFRSKVKECIGTNMQSKDGAAC